MFHRCADDNFNGVGVLRIDLGSDYEKSSLIKNVLDTYKNYLAMRIDFRIFSAALNGIGGTEGALLQRYISKEVDLPGIAAERCISYETAKGKIRDLKKFLKEKTLKYMQEEKAS